MPLPDLGPWGLWAAALMSLGLGLFVYSKNSAAWLNQAWMRLSAATAVWAAATALMDRAPSALWALGWARVAQAAFGLVPVFLLQFALALAEDSPAPHRSALAWSRRAGALFALLGLTPLMVKDVQSELAFRYYPSAGPFYGLFVLWFLGVFISSLWILLQGYRRRVGYRRNQLRYVILGTSIGMASFASAIPLVFGVPVPPAVQGLLIFYALITYAIVRWRLMDISIVIRNTLLYASLYSILVGLFVVVVVFFGQLLFYGPAALDRRVLWMCLVALSVVTLLVRPLDTWLRRMTDRLLFQKKYEWQKTLKEASKGMTQVTSVDKLLKLMAHFIGMRVRVTHVAILQRAGDRYNLEVSRGRDKRPTGFSVPRDNPLIAWLEEKKEVLTLDEVRGWLRSEKLFPHRTVIRRTLEEILREMNLLGAQVCVPAAAKSQMLGLLVLGEKLSGDPFIQEDLDVLSTLASEGAIALENAQLYQQLVSRMGEIEGLYQREHRLFIHTAIALAAAVDARDPYTHGHTERCTAYAMVVADQFHNYPEIQDPRKFREVLKVAALLHDIGKIGSPDEILRKPAKLTPKEMKKMQEHPVVGAIILQPIKGMEEVATAVRTHHERFDGKGYPDGLKGQEIPFMTRIISIADTFDSMTTDRPYRKRLSDAASIKEIQECSGGQFDPVVVDAFLKAYREGRLMKRPVEATEMIA
ncbi:MAG: HD domain-containing protein [Candidatus Omnitrophica bacterium]|nr:HD domain-containing protein [Candidatus Omnitrophota bacterium]